APICLMWLVVQRFVIEPARVRLPEVALALLHIWLGLVFLGFAFLGDRSSTMRMDLLELMLAFGAPFLLLKLVAPPSRLNDALIVLSSMVLALGAAATAPGHWPLLILLVFLASACWSIPILVRREDAGSDSTRIRVVSDGEGWSWAPHAAAAALTVAGLLLGTLLYLFIPRLSPDRSDPETEMAMAERRRRAGTRNVSGFAEEMNLGDIGQIKRDHRVAFEAQLTYYGTPYDPPPVRRTMLLLRAMAWDRYEAGEGRWAQARRAMRELPRGGRLARGKTPVDWRFRSLGYDGKRLFLPQRSRRIRSGGITLEADAYDGVVATEELREYGVGAGDPVTNTVDLRRLRADRSRPELLAVPEELREDLLARLPVAYGARLYDRLEAVGRFFTQGEFRYTLQLPKSLPENVDPLIAFLDRRGGHCELFASAACLLLRLHGVPARVAGGLRLVKEGSRGQEGFFRARYSNAHAWVEIYCEGVGFVARDFTPPDHRAVNTLDTEGDESAADLGIGGRGSGEGGARRARAEIFDPTRPFSFTRRDQERFRRRVGELASSLPYRGIALGAGLLLLLLLVRGRVRTWRMSPLRVKGGATSTLKFYARFLRECNARGYRRRRHETPREFLATLPDELRTKGAEITARFEALRYGS
ncbi:MAG: transglutaminaseTgpA domain-containing protein, partial [Planctomycetota bacterium]